MWIDANVRVVCFDECAAPFTIFVFCLCANEKKFASFFERESGQYTRPSGNRVSGKRVVGDENGNADTADDGSGR